MTPVNEPQSVERRAPGTLPLARIGHDAESQSLVLNQRDVFIAEGLGRCTEAQAITMASHGRDSEQRALARIRRFGARLNRDVGARINRQLVVVVSDVEV